jgi:hypothetical protein
MAVVDDLRRRLPRPGHQPHRAGIGLERDVDDGRVGQPVLLVRRIFAGDGLDEDRLGQAQRSAVEEFLRRGDLAARNAGDIRHKALHLRHMVLGEPFTQINHGDGDTPDTFKGRTLPRRAASAILTQ